MATVDIPDRICSHCGGITWFVSSEKTPTKNNPEKRVAKYKCKIKYFEKRSRTNKRRYAALSEDKKKQMYKRNYQLYGAKQLEKEKEKRRIYRLNNPIVKKPKKSEEEKKIKRKIWQKQWWQLNKNRPDIVEKRKEKEKRKSKRRIQTLPNVYLKHQLKHNFKLSPEFITDDCINKYKTYLLAFRQLKQLENEKETSN